MLGVIGVDGKRIGRQRTGRTGEPVKAVDMGQVTDNNRFRAECPWLTRYLWRSAPRAILSLGKQAVNTVQMPSCSVVEIVAGQHIKRSQPPRRPTSPKIRHYNSSVLIAL